MLIEVLAVIALVGLVLWAVNSFIPMQAQYRNALNVIAVVGLVVWLVNLFVPGLTASVRSIRLGSEPLINVLGVIVIVGAVLWGVNAVVPMQPKYKQALNILAVVFLCIWVISLFVPSLGHIGR